jgi:hypothetical protein
MLVPYKLEVLPDTNNPEHTSKQFCFLPALSIFGMIALQLLQLGPAATVCCF